MRRFSQIDVFSSAALTGNPLAVVIDADGMSASTMQALARWTNLSETAFLLTPTDPRAQYRARIFTPDGEIDFAGHPTLGCCHAWLQTRCGEEIGERIVQECNIGLVEVRRTRDGLAFGAPPLKRAGQLGDELTRRIASALRIDADEIIDGQWVDNGAGWAGVLLGDAAAVLALKPGRIELDVGVIGPHTAGAPADFEVRAFFPKRGATAEDPVTGSLNAGLAQWLTATGRAKSPYTVRQGTAIGHCGLVNVARDEETVWIGGAVSTIITGQIAL